MGQNTCIPHDMTIYWLSESHFLRSLLHNRSSTAGRRNATCPCQKRRLQGATEKPKPRCTWDHWDHGKMWMIHAQILNQMNLLKYVEILKHISMVIHCTCWQASWFLLSVHLQTKKSMPLPQPKLKTDLLLQQDCIRWICIQVAKWLMHYLSDVHFENHPKNNCSSWHTSP